MMKCGHAANGINTKTGTPCCVICVGLDPGAEIIAESPNLAGRKAKCGDCDRVVDSNESLAFFEYKGEGSRRALEICTCGYSKTAHEITNVENGSCSNFTPHGAYEYDSYYCGCRGWD